MVCVTARHQRGQGRLPHANHGTVGAAKVETSMLSGARRDYQHPHETSFQVLPPNEWPESEGGCFLRASWR